MPLIVIDGIDGSGKTVQSKMLADELRLMGFKCRELSFPRYECDSSVLVKHYLNGDYGKNPNDVNPYAASMFYAVDQLASFLEDWKEAYYNKEIIISNRYSTSSLIHQGAKLPEERRPRFFRWLSQTVHDYMDIPVPDLTILLDISPELSRKFRSEGERVRKGDIHENHEDHLSAAAETARLAATYFNWKKVKYTEEFNTPEDIHRAIMDIVLSERGLLLS
jgi:dTMP kinase